MPSAFSDLCSLRDLSSKDQNKNDEFEQKRLVFVNSYANEHQRAAKNALENVNEDSVCFRLCPRILSRKFAKLERDQN